MKTVEDIRAVVNVSGATHVTITMTAEDALLMARDIEVGQFIRNERQAWAAAVSGRAEQQNGKRG